jgi:hypothetical protein
MLRAMTDAIRVVEGPGLRARRLRGTFLLAWMPAVVGCFLPLALGLSPAGAIPALASAVSSPRVGDTIFLDRPTQVLLLSLALGACSILVTLPWRLAFGWRSPEGASTRVTGRFLTLVTLAATSVAAAVLLAGVVDGDASSIAPLIGVAVGVLSALVLLLPKWRALPAGSRCVGALDALYLACVLGSLATTAQLPTTGWWLLAWGALVSAAELAALPKLE